MRMLFKKITLFISFCFLMIMIPLPAAAASDVWDGTTDTSWYTDGGTEFTLTTAEELAGVADLVYQGNTFAGQTITLDDDILLNNAGSNTNAWTSVGDAVYSFQGTFDGNGHTVSGVYIDTANDYQGLFGYVGTGGTIKNVGVVDSSISGRFYIGGVVGYFGGSEILNCYNTGSVATTLQNNKGTYSYYTGIGGVVGYNSSGIIRDCYNTGTVTGIQGLLGGVVGVSKSGSIMNCYNTGAVSASGDWGVDYVGGVAGIIGNGDITGCYNTGTVTATTSSAARDGYTRGANFIGGVIGSINGVIKNCYNVGTVSCYSIVGGYYTGGVAGANYGTMKGCYNEGSVTVNADYVTEYGTQNIGGVAGISIGAQPGTIGSTTDCFNTGTVSGAVNLVRRIPGDTKDLILSTIGVGGVVGSSALPIINCYNKGAVSGGQKVGGVAGDSSSAISVCYNRGPIGQTGDIAVGGVAGNNAGTLNSCYSAGTVTGSSAGGVVGWGNTTDSCYWDTTICPGTNGNCVGKTTDEMKAPEFAALMNEGKLMYTMRWAPDSTSQNDGYPVPDYFEFWTDNAATSFAGGTGTPTDPYLISNASELALLSKNVNAGTEDYSDQYFKLTADIDLGVLDLGGKVWTSIGWMTSPYVYKSFNGTFDGDNHSISNMYIDNGAYHGLFGCVGAGGTIENVTVLDCYIRGLSYVGGIAGYNFGTIMNCSTTGTIAGRIIVTVPPSTAGSNVGGVAGYNAGGEITNCYNNASVSGSFYVGGVVGTNWFNKSNVFGTVSNCCNTGNVKGISECIGGVVGYSVGTVNNCCNTGSVGGTYIVGGVVGYIYQDMAFVTNCFNTGSVTESGTGAPADTMVVGTGGVVGYNDGYTVEGSIIEGTIRNCYNTGAISGRKNVGGVVGENIWSINSCYSTGKVSGSTNVGALIGGNRDKATYCYWDSTINPSLSGMGLAESYNNTILGILDSTCSSYSTADMKSNTFVTLLNANKGSYNTWIAVANDYPTLDGIPYTVVFDKNGGNTEAYPIIAATNYGGTITLPTTNPTRTNYTFAGWNTQADGNGTAFTASTAVTANIKVYAQWTAIPPTPCTVTFDKNGGDTEASPVTADTLSGGTVALPATSPTRSNYTFASWNTQADGNGTAFTASTAVMAGITVYAQWTTMPPTPCTVTFDKNGGDTDATPATATVSFGGTVTLPTANPTRANYTFAGWNTQADGNGTAFTASTAVTANITVYAQWTAITAEAYTVTFDKNGGDADASPATATTLSGETVTLPTTNPTRSSYTFAGWNTQADGTGTAFTALTAVTGNIIVYAKWSENSSAGSGGGSTSGSSTTSTNTTATTTTGGTTTTTTTAATGTDGRAQASVTTAQMTSVIEQTQQGSESTVLNIDVNAPGSSTGVSLTIPQSSFDTLSDSSIGSFTVTTPLASLTFDDKTLSAINSSASGDIQITVQRADTSGLSAEDKARIGSRPVYDFTVTSGNKTISEFGGGTAAVSVPYTLAPGENPNNVVTYYISDSGELIMVPNCIYDEATGMVIFTTTHFSVYAVGCNNIKFSDVSGWYKDYVNFLAAREIINGAGDGTFRPNANITRAQFVTILANLSAKDMKSHTISSFIDVAPTDWYGPSVQWAYENGVVAGSNGKFEPNAYVTRQDIAVIIARYAEKVANCTLSEANNVAAFTDNTDIAAYAANAVKVIQQAGIISGNSDGSFAPKANATRAEAAKMTALLLRGMIM